MEARQALRDALRRWLAQVVAAIPSPERVRDDSYSWCTSEEEDEYEQQQRQRVVDSDEFVEAAALLPAYRDVLAVLATRGDPSTWGQVAGVPGLGWVQQPAAISYLIWNTVMPWEPGAEGRLAEFAERMAVLFFEHEVRVSCAWPLPALPPMSHTLQLDAHVSIDHLTRAEMEAALEKHLWPLEHDETHLKVSNPCCLRYQADFPISMQGLLGPVAERPETDMYWDRFQTAWRLCSAERLHAYGVIWDARIGPPLGQSAIEATNPARSSRLRR
jgi:hypothetical protein